MVRCDVQRRGTIRRIAIRRGDGSPLLLAMFVSIVIVLGLFWVLLKLRPDTTKAIASNQIVRIYCAASIVKPVEAMVARYNQKFQTSVEVTRTGGSGELLGQIKTEFETGMIAGADIFISADDQLLNAARREGMVAKIFSLAKQQPVIAVAGDSLLEIKSLTDLLHQSEIKFGVASDGAAIGTMIRQIAKRDGLLERLESSKTMESENVMALAQALTSGSLDAAVLWDTVVEQVNQTGNQSNEQSPMSDEGSAILRIACLADSEQKFHADIGIGIVASTRSPDEALRFIRFLTAPNTAQSIFQTYGFQFVPGDRWLE